MAIVVDGETRVLVQGATGGVGRGFVRRMRDGGTRVVAGVVPGRGGREVSGVPVYETVLGAMEETQANLAMVCVPPPHVLDAVSESLFAGVSTVVVYTEGVGIADSLAMAVQAQVTGATLLGPASAGVLSPGAANVSDLRDDLIGPGSVGVVSRSGTLTYEVLAPLRERAVGASTVCCLGGDPIVGTSYADVLARFEADPQTRVVVLLGEIGGVAETEAAQVAARMTKPVVAYLAGRHAPSGKPMGHAGALLRSEAERVEEKARALAVAGVRTVRTVLDVPAAVQSALREVDRAVPAAPDRLRRGEEARPS